MWETRLISAKVRPLVLVLTVAFMTAASVSVVSAGHRWSGMDPELTINDDKVNVVLEWQGHTCDIEGPVEFVIVVPEGADYTFIGESSGQFDCDHDGDIDISLASNTTVIEGIGNENLLVGSVVNAQGENFRTRVKIFKNRQLEKTCQGLSNQWIRCVGPTF